MRAPGATMAFAVMLGTASLTATAGDAEARTDQRRDTRTGNTVASYRHNAAPAATTAAAHRGARTHGRGAGRSGARYTGLSYGGGISCVPYVREVTGMAISGNGRDWWHNAAGLYARGNRPEPGSVLAFPGSGGMRSGHVAVVSRVLSSREVLIDHANWGGPGIRRGSVMRGVSVVDVSPHNDWTQVRVQVGWDSGTYGRVYPAHGFILNRPDPTGGTMLAGGDDRGGFRSISAASAATNRGSFRRGQAYRIDGMQRWEELAEQPISGSGTSPHANQHLDLSIRTLGTAGGRR